jgi:hypothetical protein
MSERQPRDGTSWFTEHSGAAMFLVGCAMVFSALYIGGGTAAVTSTFLGCGLMLVGALLPRLTGTIRVTPGSIELALAERLEATRREVETRAPGLEEAALARAVEELVPELLARRSTSPPAEDAPRPAPSRAGGRWMWATAGAAATALVMGGVLTVVPRAPDAPPQGATGADAPVDDEPEGVDDSEVAPPDGEDASEEGLAWFLPPIERDEEIDPQAAVVVPDVTGQTLGRATAALAEAGIRDVVVHGLRDTDDAAVSRVTSMRPPAGTTGVRTVRLDVYTDTSAVAVADPGEPRLTASILLLGMLVLIGTLWVARRSRTRRTSNGTSQAAITGEAAPDFARRIVDELVDGSVGSRNGGLTPPPPPRAGSDT